MILCVFPQIDGCHGTQGTHSNDAPSVLLTKKHEASNIQDSKIVLMVEITTGNGNKTEYPFSLMMPGKGIKPKVTPKEQLPKEQPPIVENLWMSPD